MDHRKSRCIIAETGRLVPTSWLLLPDDNLVDTAKALPLKRRVLVFTGCSDKWQLDENAAPMNGVYRQRVVVGGMLCSQRNGSSRHHPSSANGTSCCSAGKFSKAFSVWRITDVHVVLDQSDFTMEDSSGTVEFSFADVLRCYVALLEAVVSVVNKPFFFFHIFKPEFTTLRDGPERFRNAPPDDRLCLDPFPVALNEDFSDVLLSAAYTFTGVSELLYGLDGVYIVVHVRTSSSDHATV